MAGLGDGVKSALIVVDLQVGVLRACWQVERVVHNAALVIGKARAANVPIIWVQHADDELTNDSPDWRWADGLGPIDCEPVVGKSYNSAFEATALERELAALGIAHLVIVGAATNWCVRATAFAALERGYDLTLIGDAHTTQSLELEDGSRLEAADLVKDLNIAMTWLCYPGRKNNVVNAQDVLF